MRCGIPGQVRGGTLRHARQIRQEKGKGCCPFDFERYIVRRAPQARLANHCMHHCAFLDMRHHLELELTAGGDVAFAAYATDARKFTFEITDVSASRGDTKLTAEADNSQFDSGMQPAEAKYRPELRTQIESSKARVRDLSASGRDGTIERTIEADVGRHRSAM